MDPEEDDLMETERVVLSRVKVGIRMRAKGIGDRSGTLKIIAT